MKVVKRITAYKPLDMKAKAKLWHESHEDNKLIIKHILEEEEEEEEE